MPAFNDKLVQGSQVEKEIQEIFLTCYDNRDDSQYADSLQHGETYVERISEAADFIKGFQKFLNAIPLAIALRQWLESQKADPNFRDLLHNVKLLVDLGIIPRKNDDGGLADLKYFQALNHASSIQLIRCQGGLTFQELERLVDTYMRFMQHLSQVTLRLVHGDPDPDRQRVAHKALRYEKFVEFSRGLSDRDCLIALLMYYGDCAMIDVINLKVNQVDVKGESITVSEREIKLSKYVMLRLGEFIADKEDNDLVFTNRKGGQVNRSRLYRSFKSAGEKMSPPLEISPTTLLTKR